jgi:hypothetical protein
LGSLYPEAIFDVEGFKLLSIAGVGDFSIGHDAIDIHDQ